VLVGAVAAGVGFQVPNTANVLGYEAQMLEQGVKCGFGDVRLYPRRGRRIDDAMATMARVRAAPGIHAVDAILILPGAIGHEGYVQSVATLAVDAPDGRWPFRVVEGQALPPGDPEGILVGRPLARRLGVGVGDRVDLRVVLGRNDLDEDVGRYRLIVRGLFTGTFTVCATDTIIVDRRFIAGELGEPGATDMLLVYSDDPEGADALAAGLAGAFAALDARSWTVDSALLRSAIHGSAAVAAFSTAMVLVAVGLPMAALLYIHSLNRRRQVALMAAIGIGGPEIFIAFLLQALFVGLTGIALGCPIGYGLVRYFRAHPIFEMEQFVLRPVLAARTFLWPALTVLCATLVSGVYPAWRAARIDPAAILRRGT
jgi:lipoprotein-releasing system permease protein